MSFIKLIKRPYFYIQMLLAIAIILILVRVAFFGLSIFTLHGDVFKLPDFREQQIDSLVCFADEYGLRYTVLDSIFDIERLPGTVVRQDPPPYAKVKENRMIYVTIVASLSEKVKMPNLADLSLRQAVDVLEQNKLRVESVEFKQGFDRNAVQEQLYNDETIEPDSLIPIGSSITIVVSCAKEGDTERIPLLIGMNRRQAVKTIHQSTFNVGKELFKDDFTPEGSRVYMQNPEWSEFARQEVGSLINLYYCSDSLMNFDSLLFWVSLDPVMQDSVINGLVDFEKLFDSND